MPEYSSNYKKFKYNGVSYSREVCKLPGGIKEIIIIKKEDGSVRRASRKEEGGRVFIKGDFYSCKKEFKKAHKNIDRAYSSDYSLSSSDYPLGLRFWWWLKYLEDRLDKFKKRNSTEKNKPAEKVKPAEEVKPAENVKQANYREETQSDSGLDDDRSVVKYSRNIQSSLERITCMLNAINNIISELNKHCRSEVQQDI